MFVACAMIAASVDFTTSSPYRQGIEPIPLHSKLELSREEEQRLTIVKRIASNLLEYELTLIEFIRPYVPTGSVWQYTFTIKTLQLSINILDLQLLSTDDLIHDFVYPWKPSVGMGELK